MKIFAIDPGNKMSAYAYIVMPGFKILEFGKVYNEELKHKLKSMLFDSSPLPDMVAIEMIASYGMAVGKDVFDTCVWIGRFAENVPSGTLKFIYRKDEKLTLCGNSRAKDGNIMHALIDLYAKHDFKTGKGTKKNPDVFYGVSADVWQAIAVGVTAFENSKDEEV